ncbi:MAG: kinase/pyrophosphorylase [Candidatus Atribacteria bacterium]|nr:kinase/pyrophosphorylase [Candidatus Atribacteria bacterium]
MTSDSNGMLISDDFSIFVVSDGTGKTAYSMVQAALAQFDLPRVNIQRFDHIKNKEEIFSILDMARPHKDVLVYTIVNDDFAQAILAESFNRSILVLDLLGPIVNILNKLSCRQPRGEPDLLRLMERDSSTVLEAVEYALEKSTGVSVWNLDQAQVVILTVWYPHRNECAMVLAEKGIKCGYLILNPDFPLPMNLDEILGNKTRKVLIGVVMDPEYLRDLRSERIAALGLNRMEYKADIQVIQQELDFAKSIYHRLDCRVIDITHLSTRDVINQILFEIKKQREEAE